MESVGQEHDMKSHAAFLLIATLFVALAAAQQAAQTGSGTVPQLIPHSGIAKDVSGKALSGVVGITFLLYQQEQGGSPLWLETQNVQADSRGHYPVQLGARLPNGVPNDIFVSGEARWLGIQIAGQSEAARVMLLSVPYAMKAGDAQTLGGLPASAFILAAPMSGGASGSALVNTATFSTAAPSTTTSQCDHHGRHRQRDSTVHYGDKHSELGDYADWHGHDGESWHRHDHTIDHIRREGQARQSGGQRR
jgi:hypothetical protein